MLCPPKLISAFLKDSRFMAEQKHPYNVYTVMLICSALLMLVACILMGIEWARF